jgi:hypothetical protein
MLSKKEQLMLYNKNLDLEIKKQLLQLEKVQHFCLEQMLLKIILKIKLNKQLEIKRK